MRPVTCAEAVLFRFDVPEGRRVLEGELPRPDRPVPRTCLPTGFEEMREVAHGSGCDVSGLVVNDRSRELAGCGAALDRCAGQPRLVVLVPDVLVAAGPRVDG